MNDFICPICLLQYEGACCPECGEYGFESEGLTLADFTTHFPKIVLHEILKQIKSMPPNPQRILLKGRILSLL